MVTLGATLCLLLAAGCLGPDTPRAQQIVLAIQPTDDPLKIQASAAQLETFLEQRTGYDIKIIIPLSNSGVVEALRFEHAEAAFLSAWPSYLAHKIAGAEIVLAEKREVVIGTERQEQPYYFSYYIVPKHSPLQTLAELGGKRVAYPSATSTSGYVFPVAKLVSEGLLTRTGATEADPKQFFSSVLFAGGYGQAWQALKNGQVDASVIAGDVNAQLYFDVLDQTRILATQGPVPSHGVVFASHLDEPRRTALHNALLELKGEHRDLMRSLVSAIFVEFTPTTTANHTAALKAALDQVGFRFQERLG